MLITPNYLKAMLRKYPIEPLDAHQKDAKQTNTMGPTLPPNDSPLDSPGPVSGTQAKQIPQPTSSVPSKRKIKSHNDLNLVLPQKPSRLCPRYHTQMTIEPLQ